MRGIGGKIDKVAYAVDVRLKGLEGEIEVDGPGVMKNMSYGSKKGGVGGAGEREVGFAEIDRKERDFGTGKDCGKAVGGVYLGLTAGCWGRMGAGEAVYMCNSGV